MTLKFNSITINRKNSKVVRVCWSVLTSREMWSAWPIWKLHSWLHLSVSRVTLAKVTMSVGWLWFAWLCFLTVSLCKCCGFFSDTGWGNAAVCLSLSPSLTVQTVVSFHLFHHNTDIWFCSSGEYRVINKSGDNWKELSWVESLCVEPCSHVFYYDTWWCITAGS